MKRVSLKHAEKLISVGEPVVSNTGSLVGDTSFDDNGWEYTVTSYGVPIGKVRREVILNPDGSWAVGLRGARQYKKTLWITDQKWSVTTSKHTNLARRALKIQMGDTDD
jgi:hypothetical protein